jgi:ABC-type amino acid transport substrate-binding protein
VSKVTGFIVSLTPCGIFAIAAVAAGALRLEVIERFEVYLVSYAFFNRRGELVGFDIEMAHQLAEDLDVALELVPASRTILESGLDAETCDLVMSGTVMTPYRAMRLLYSAPYLDETLAFFVPDPARRKSVPVDRIEDTLGRHSPAFDAVVRTAERGSAYTLLHPKYSVAVPKPRPLKVPLAYLIAGRDETFASVVNVWIDLKQKDGTIDALFAHWILGRDASPPHRRWSILGDGLRPRK